MLLILAIPTTDIDQRITLDGQEIELIGYVINGNNYFQLRDLGDKLGFGVSWDNDTPHRGDYHRTYRTD